MGIQGQSPVETLVRGTTLKEKTFTYIINSGVPDITSAYLGVKQGTKVIMAPTGCLVSGNVVTRPEISAAITYKWPVATLTWDIETTISGVERVYVAGTFDVLYTNQ